MSYEHLFLYALLLTLLAEVPVVFLCARYLYKVKDNQNIIFAGIITSTLTLPYFWFILPVFISDRLQYIVLGELFIIFIEAFIYYKIFKLKFLQALIISLFANVTSIVFGLIIL
jgi:hypothetical protein